MKLIIGRSAPGFKFKEGDCIVKSEDAKLFQEGKIDQRQFDAVKLYVLEVGIKIEGYDGYQLVYDSPLKNQDGSFYFESGTPRSVASPCLWFNAPPAKSLAVLRRFKNISEASF
jgi:hypothetical protein